MLPAIFELSADKVDAVKIYAHCEPFVLDLGLFTARAFLRQRLIVKGKSENHIRPNLACVQFAVKEAIMYCNA